VPPRKRKTVYPPSRSARPATPGAAPGTPVVPRTLATINRDALTARDDLAVGTRVQVLGAGLYAGETAVIERLTSGVIPSAYIRTDSGRTRIVRTVDLGPVPNKPAE
jgi:hypothetical protein